jgi:hypothetical protein
MKFFRSNSTRFHVTASLLLFAMLLPVLIDGVLIVNNESVEGDEKIVVSTEIKLRRLLEMGEFLEKTGITKAMIPVKLDFSKIEIFELARLPAALYRRLSDAQLESIFARHGIVATLNSLGPERIKLISHHGSKLCPTAQEIAFLQPEAFAILDPYRTLITGRLSQPQFYELLHYAPNPDYAHIFKAHDTINRRNDLTPAQIAQTIAVNVIGRGIDHNSPLPVKTQERLLMVSRDCPRVGWLASSTDDLSSLSMSTSEMSSQMESENLEGKAGKEEEKAEELEGEKEE